MITHLKVDATGNLGFSSYQKWVVDVQVLAYGVVSDLADEYIHMSDSTCLDLMYKLCKVVVQVLDT
jgi:hypothetical protein